MEAAAAIVAVTICLFPVAAVGGNRPPDTGIATPAALQILLKTNGQGAVVDLCGVDPRSCPFIPMSQTWTGGKLIFSDSPESPTRPGILYQDTHLPATGSNPNRIFAYHVNNNPSGPMKFSVLIKNAGRSMAILTVRQAGIAGPSGNYALVGESAFYRWLTNRTMATIKVPPGRIARLDTNFDSVDVANGALINGIWDYTFSQAHTVTICAMEPRDNPITTAPKLALLPRDIHDRGTFPNCNKTYDTSVGAVVDTMAGIRQFPLAGHGDTYATGYDEAISPPAAARDNGNYGVFYTIHLNLAFGDGRALALLASPQGGSWCGAVAAAPGILPGGVFAIPSNGSTISSPDEAAIVGEYFPNGPKTIQIEFMPTGASSFPVLLLTAPFSATAVISRNFPGTRTMNFGPAQPTQGGSR